MRNFCLSAALLFLVGMSLSACAYQVLPDEDPTGPHHTELRHDRVSDPDPQDV